MSELGQKALQREKPQNSSMSKCCRSATFGLKGLIHVIIIIYVHVPIHARSSIYIWEGGGGWGQKHTEFEFWCAVFWSSQKVIWSRSTWYCLLPTTITKQVLGPWILNYLSIVPYSTYYPPMMYYPPTPFFGQKLCYPPTLYHGTAPCTGNDNNSRQVGDNM